MYIVINKHFQLRSSISRTTPRVMRQKNMVMSLVGLGNKNDCAGEDQQQFTLPTDSSIKFNIKSVAIATKCQKLTCCMNASDVLVHERTNSLFFWCLVSIL
jgi:hypothetical protein